VALRAAPPSVILWPAARHPGRAALSDRSMSDNLDAISRLTLAHYASEAEAFFAGTIDHDVSQNVAALLDAITVAAPFTLLDLGCGPGRDLKKFTELGHHAIGLDGSAEFVAMARAYSGCEVWHQDFLHLDLAPERFDGVFANASLFHVPRAALPGVLAALHRTLKPGAVLFSSNPRGDNEEGWNGARYGSYHDYPAWERYLVAAGFAPLHHYYRPPGLPRAQQPWLASLWRKLPVQAGTA
jgi:SAM-dependent methyltransferase